MFRATVAAVLAFGVVVLVAVVSVWCRRATSNKTAAKECVCVLVSDAQRNIERKEYVGAEQQLKSATKLVAQHSLGKLRCDGLHPDTMLEAVAKQRAESNARVRAPPKSTLDTILR